MKKGKIFLLEDGKLAGMSEERYEVENVLQKELANHPALLAGEQINPDQALRWILIDREIGVPDEESSGGRWSLDHLFVDQHGIPTLVEVKRSEDTRSRRKVVAQMLDYAANSTRYWDIDQIRANYNAHVDDPKDSIQSFIPEGQSIEEFWTNVKNNLDSGVIRLLFVADEVPSELVSIVEFLNEQMDPAEVLAVEVKKYSGEGHEALVPRVRGQTEQARKSKSSSGRKNWSWESMKDHARKKLSTEEVSVIEKLYEFVQKEADRVSFGSGSQNAAFMAYFDKVSEKNTFKVTTAGKVSFFRLQNTVKNEPEEVNFGEGELEWLSSELSEVKGDEINLGDNDYLPLASLADSEKIDAFKEIILNFLDKCDSSS